MSKVTRKLRVIDDREHDNLLKFAFASSDQKIVDQHFGSAKSLVIYGIGVDEKHLFDVVQFGELKQDGNEDKLAIKLDLLENCVAVYSRACGASAVKQLLARGIQPVKVSEGSEIKQLITELQQELKEGPSAWLAKAVNKNTLDESRFDEMEMEGWEE